jgi:hypothetical protein
MWCMPHAKKSPKQRGGRSRRTIGDSAETRYTVALAPSLANQAERYARTVDASPSEASAALARLGLNGHEARMREFFEELKDNLASDDPNQQGRLVDEFCTLILGR